MKILGECCRIIGGIFPKVNQSRKQYKNAQEPWITKDILRQMAQQNKLYKRFLRTSDPVVYSAYKQFRNYVTRLKENAKVQYYRTLLGTSKNSGES